MILIFSFRGTWRSIVPIPHIENIISWDNFFLFWNLFHMSKDSYVWWRKWFFEIKDYEYNFEFCDWRFQKIRTFWIPIQNKYGLLLNVFHNHENLLSKNSGGILLQKSFFIQIEHRWSPLCRKSMLNIDSFEVFFVESMMTTINVR